MEKEILAAVINGGGGGGGIRNPAISPLIGQGEGVSALNLFISNLIGAVLVFGVLIALGFAISGAVEYIMAEGEEQKIKNARNKIAGAFAGLIFLFTLFAIIRIIGNFVGLKDLGRLQLDLGPFFFSF